MSEKPKKRTKANVKKTKKKANSDDEALEESDDVDEGQEDLVDYMSGSSRFGYHVLYFGHDQLIFDSGKLYFGQHLVELASKMIETKF